MQTRELIWCVGLEVWFHAQPHALVAYQLLPSLAHSCSIEPICTFENKDGCIKTADRHREGRMDELNPLGFEEKREHT